MSDGVSDMEVVGAQVVELTRGAAQESTFRSKFTCWGRMSRERRAEARWHGFPMSNPTMSYCGKESYGRKRFSPPKRDQPICEKCAAACGFARRSQRGGHERRKGSTRLGTVTERLEGAVARLESVLAAIADTE